MHPVFEKRPRYVPVAQAEDISRIGMHHRHGGLAHPDKAMKKPLGIEEDAGFRPLTVSLRSKNVGCLCGRAKFSIYKTRLAHVRLQIWQVG